jgi:hypothetical protein
VAANGAVIEWQQILTTHNLAALVETVGLREELRPHLPDLARRCFGWVCRHLRQTESAPWKGRLQGVKNAAYSWRQMVFFVSLLPEGGAGEFLGWAAGHLSEQPAAFWDRFAPALEGLRRAARSLPADDADGSARRFLGWTTSRHWLLA